MDKTIAMIRARHGLANQIARACGTSRQAVNQWKQVPAARVMAVAEILDLPPEQIRPDVFARKMEKTNPAKPQS
jgi:DNA-binding transcriptional regulator YdaS (Cro superfamily)